MMSSRILCYLSIFRNFKVITRVSKKINETYFANKDSHNIIVELVKIFVRKLSITIDEKKLVEFLFENNRLDTTRMHKYMTEYTKI